MLIDSDFHCQIAGFQLSRHLDATVTRVWSMSLNFAAPELFKLCPECGGSGCDECHEDDDMSREKWKKTKETDVYAFGCLYYTVGT